MKAEPGIPVKVAEEEAAALFINFFVTRPEAGAILQTNRGVPCSPVVRQAIDAGATPTDAEVYRTVPQGPNLPNDQKFVSELALSGQAVGFGQTSVEEAAVELQALIDRLIVKLTCDCMKQKRRGATRLRAFSF